MWLDEGPEDDTENHTTHKSKLLFPNLGALDLSNNKIREIPSAINEMSNLSVLNISGNSGSYFFSCHLFFFLLNLFDELVVFKEQRPMEVRMDISFLHD